MPGAYPPWRRSRGCHGPAFVPALRNSWRRHRCNTLRICACTPSAGHSETEGPRWMSSLSNTDIAPRQRSTAPSSAASACPPARSSEPQQGRAKPNYLDRRCIRRFSHHSIIPAKTGSGRIDWIRLNSFSNLPTDHPLSVPRRCFTTSRKHRSTPRSDLSRACWTTAQPTQIL